MVAPNARQRSTAAATASTSAASATVRVKIETQSSERHAGTTPQVLSNPFVGLSPTRLLNAAGIRPDPAVSVPSAKSQSPAATATADPLLDPPGRYSAPNGFFGTPYGERTPTNPVANWSRLVLPTGTAPAAINRSTTGADS